MSLRTLSIGLLALSIHAQGQETFLVHFDSVQVGYGAIGWDVEEVSDGYLVFGQQFSTDGLYHVHVFVRKLSLQGVVVQQHEYFPGDTCSMDISYIDPVCVDTGSGFASAVTKVGPLPFEYRFSIFHFDQQGDTLSTRELWRTNAEDSTVYTVRQTRRPGSGGYVIVGAFDPIEVPAKALLVRVDGEGDTLWTKTYGNDDNLNEALGVAPYFDDGFLITGYRLMSGGQDDSFLIRTDSLGNQLWRREYGGYASVNGAVRTTPDSNIVTWSEYDQEFLPIDYYQQMMLTKWDSAGSIIWQKKSHYGYYSHTYDIEVLPDGGFICSGASTNHGVLARFDTNGDSLWSRYYEAFDNDDLNLLYDVNPTSDGGYILCGYGFQAFGDPHPNLATIYVVKTDSFGCVVPGCQNVGVQEYELGLQDRLMVAPNPATDRVNMELELPKGYATTGAVSVVVFDATGQEVVREKVEHDGAVLSHTLRVADWQPGLYHVHLADEKKWLAGAKVVVE